MSAPHPLSDGSPSGSVSRYLPWCFCLFACGVAFSIAAAHIALGVWLLVWLVSLARGEIRFRGTPIDKILLIFLAVVIITAFSGINPGRSVKHVFSLWHIVIYLLVVHSLPDQRWFLRGFSVLLVSAGLNAALGISQHFSPVFYLFQGEDTLSRWIVSPSRELGTYSHSMTFGGQMMLVGVFGGVLYLWWVRDLKGKKMLGIPLVLILTSIPLTFLRNVWVGSFSGLGLAMLFRGRRLVFGFVVVTGLVCTLLYMLEPGFRVRIKSIVDPEFSSNVERIKMWKVSFEIFKKNPITGVGPGNYREGSETYRKKYGVVGASHPHNNLLSQLTEKGLLGLGVYLVLWVIFYKEAWKAWKRTDSASIQGVLVGGLGSITAFHIGGMFEGNFGDSEVAMMMWLLVGCTLWALQRSGQRELAKTAGDPL